MCVCVCVFVGSDQGLDYYLLECIFAFTLMSDVNDTFREPSVEHTCNTMI